MNKPPIQNPKSKIQNLFLLLLLFTLTACSPTDTSWQRIQSTGTLTVGLDPTFPPFENAETDELHGLDVDLARALGDQLGVNVQFTYFGYDGLYDALATEQVDLLISALVIDPAKTRDFAYSDPYFNSGQFLVTHHTTNDITSLDDLGHRTVAVELGSEGHVLATQWQKRVPNLTVTPLNTPDDALWVVRQQEADAAVVDHVSGRLYLQNAPDLQLIPEPVTVEPYALVVRIEDQTLLEKLNEALETLEKTGRLTQIKQTWLGTP